MALLSGMKLGPYEIISAIGAGGMAEVYRAKDTRLDRTVAIKILPSHLSSNADLKARFEHEARAISSLSHPHICALYIKSADGSGTEEPLLATQHTKFPDDWSPDGKYIIYNDRAPKMNTDLWILPLARDQKSFPYLQTAATEIYGKFHPSGEWIAYVSDESGEREIYVTEFSYLEGG